jgi:folate-binding protein YgfZ
MSDAHLIDETSSNVSKELSRTPLAEALSASQQGPLLEYRGAFTVSSFSNTPKELASLLATAGSFDLGWRTILLCAGEDHVRWLNGMVTNTVIDLKEDAGCYSFVLNSQGRIQGDLDIYRLSDSLWLETDRSQAETLRTFLDHYIIMDDVTLERDDTRTAVGIAGPRARDVLLAAGCTPVPSEPMEQTQTKWRDFSAAIIAAHSPLVPRYEIWIAAEHALDLWNALIAAGADRCGAESVEQLRILEGTLAYGVDIGSRDLPQETNQMRALHFSKGCYLGQEIVERIRSRGLVHRTFTGFQLAEEVPSKTPLLTGGQPAGELTSVARIAIPAAGESFLALGRIRLEALDRKAELTAAGVSATPCALPFDFARAAVQP